MGIMSNESDQKNRARDLDNLAAKNVSDKVDLGAAVPVDPNLAEVMGAFKEEALSDEDALDARLDSPSVVKKVKEESSKKDKQ